MNEPNQKKHCYLLGVRVDSLTYKSVVDKVIGLAFLGEGGFVCICNTHVVLEARKDYYLKRFINSANYVVSDGVTLVWALKFFGIKNAQRVTGPSLVPFVCKKAQRLKISIGFYGGEKETLKILTKKIQHRFPQLKIKYAYSPPFRTLSKEEDEKIIKEIEASEIQILFVGLGCPKQELWACEHRGRITPAIITVGAAFDFLAGVKKRAPRWVQKSGLEWLHRLISEPHRLWKRYLFGNLSFIFLISRDIFRKWLLKKRRERQV